MFSCKLRIKNRIIYPDHVIHSCVNKFVTYQGQCNTIQINVILNKKLDYYPTNIVWGRAVQFVGNRQFIVFFAISRYAQFALTWNSYSIRQVNVCGFRAKRFQMIYCQMRFGARAKFAIKNRDANICILTNYSYK